MASGTTPQARSRLTLLVLAATLPFAAAAEAPPKRVDIPAIGTRALNALGSLNASADLSSPRFLKALKLPFRHTGMESFAACKARLDAMKDDLKAWSSTPIEKNGNVWGKQTSPTTGVEILSARRARFVDYRVITNYDVTDPSQVRAQSTTTETTYACDGRVLSGVTENWAGMEMFMTLDDVPKK
ncbi:hypothetical protein [Luteibacter sp. 22Crub2.1]|uniref:hypothetical protein n=1 Tax=Luteibacter sp. 22Crub2.1 TaxID=1283288 RepID=UPI0009A717F0|nr:hypothetical protein [Luteibacter sp. 22Crub2.1]SKB71605.1 hypothetical protein SAMN05660880_02305 [Luteibacter sp. 22Crub2.1]